MIQPADEEIVVYTSPVSRGRIARWMLEETGCPHRTVVRDFGTTMKAVDPRRPLPGGGRPYWQPDHVGDAFKACAEGQSGRAAAIRARGIDDALIAAAQVGG